MQNETEWKSKIFRTTSEMVCEKIYSIFKEVFKCETRISVEYVFQKTIQNRNPACKNGWKEEQTQIKNEKISSIGKETKVLFLSDFCE